MSDWPSSGSASPAVRLLMSVRTRSLGRGSSCASDGENVEPEEDHHVGGGAFDRSWLLFLAAVQLGKLPGGSG